MRAFKFSYLLAAGSLAFISDVYATESSHGVVTIDEIADGFEQPWSVEVLPDGEILVSERSGRLIHLRPDGRRISVNGVPKVVAEGQGGLLDIMIPRDFATTRQVYLSYSKRQGQGEGTALGVGRLSQNGRNLEAFKTIFEMNPGSSGGHHFGSRIVEANDGTIFLTIGDRGDRPAAQDRSRHNGSIIRVTRDGSVPADNPFIGVDGVQPEVWSYGHRNPQGAGLDLDGNLWTAEHGAKGGDEVNRIKKGANFGWPVISYGRHYTGFAIGEGTSKEGMEQPAHYWDPSIAPSGLMIYSGKLFPDWKGDIFVGSLKFDYISRLDGDDVREVEQLKDPTTQRVRDIIEAPDGSIWFLSVGSGSLYRMSPASP